MHQIIGQIVQLAFGSPMNFHPTCILRSILGTIAAAMLFAISAMSALAHEDDEGAFAVVSLNFETNATDGDVGIQAFFDADGLKSVEIDDPKDRTIFEVEIGGGLRKIGFTELFFEGMEPLIADLAPDGEKDEAEFTLAGILKLFPPGEYEFEGKTVDGKKLKGTTLLTTVLPAGPVIVAPQEDAEVPAGKALVIDWEPVTKTILPDFGPLTVIGYQVIVSNEDNGNEFTIDLPAGMTEVTVPAAFLAASTSFDFEILVVEKSGNQTITESSFVTGG